LLDEEAQRHPEWAPTLSGTRDSEAKLLRKQEELALADRVLCPSRFVFESLPPSLRQSGKVWINPYGTDARSDTPASPSQPPDTTPPGDGPLRLLFVGELSQRKGLADLFEAIRGFSPDQVQLRLIGRSMAPEAFYHSTGVPFLWEGPRPRDEVLRHMRESDVLVLPSIVEGRALVQLEALAQGLPLLVSANTGGDDLIVEGLTGFQVPIRSSERLRERIEWMLLHRSELAGMKTSARAHAQTVTWKKFAERLIQDLEDAKLIPASR
jgi:glycosyltransferase involved in cell wall biosynthesis